jgi:hypothetical protein
MNGSVARGALPIAPLPPVAAEEELSAAVLVGAQAQHPLVDVIVCVADVSLVVVSDVDPVVVVASTVVVDEATAVSQAQQSAAATADVDVNDDEDDELDVAKVDPMQANDTSASIIF